MTATAKKLKAPFPAFGGKSRVARMVWDRIGDVDNAIEPFCFSAAWTLARPHSPRIETVNDWCCYVANFWRATGRDPEGVAMMADWPVNEADLHSRHRFLVLSEEAKAFRERMRSDPDYYDVRFAGWWCWGLCCWIGSGWCAEGAEWEQRIRSPDSTAGGVGAHPGQDNRKPRIDGGEGQLGHGVHAKGEKRPKLSGGSPGSGALGTGVHSNGEPVKKLPYLQGGLSSGCYGMGVHKINSQNRPQLADAYARGRGVHGNDNASVCADRLAWLIDWFSRLRDRFRTVRVCCGDWLRVCESDSVTTRLGITGIFLDPPYPTKNADGSESRNSTIYGSDFAGKPAETVRDEVLEYCRVRGANRKMRIAVCGYEGDGYEALEKIGWDVVSWAAAGGYGNRSAKGKANAKRERIWFSPHCKREAMLLEL